KVEKDALEIEVVDDRPEKDRKRPRDEKAAPPAPTEQELKGYGAKSQKRINELYYQANEERRQKEDVQRQLNEALSVAQRWQQENQRLQAQQAQKQQEFTEQARVRSQSEIELAQRAYAAAMEAGKPEDAAKAQVALSR